MVLWRKIAFQLTPINTFLENKNFLGYCPVHITDAKSQELPTIKIFQHLKQIQELVIRHRTVSAKQ